MTFRALKGLRNKPSIAFRKFLLFFGEKFFLQKIIFFASIFHWGFVHLVTRMVLE